MLECPHCKQGFSQFTFSGWVVNAAGSATMNDDGSISQVGALVTKCSVKPGAEFRGKHVEVKCPHCGHVEQFTAYRAVYACTISGVTANASKHVAVLDAVVHYHTDYADDLAMLILPGSLDWETVDLNKAAFDAVTSGLSRRRR